MSDRTSRFIKYDLKAAIAASELARQEMVEDGSYYDDDSFASLD